MRRNIAVLALLLAFGCDALISRSAAQAQEAAQQSIAKSIGTIKAVNGSTLTLDSSGSEVAISVQAGARILQLAPGAKDLKNAMPLQVQDLKVGDTIRARGTASADGKSLAALEVIVITRAAVAAVSDQLRQDWQKRGAGGRVESVEAATGDDLAFDDRRYLALFVAPPARVLLVDGDPGRSPMESETYFLMAALRLAPDGETYAKAPFDPRVIDLFEARGGLPDLGKSAAVVLANVAELPSAKGTQRPLLA